MFALASQSDPVQAGVRHLVTADVRDAACGDRAAAERLIRSILPRIRNLVRYLVYRDADVDDLAQDALIAILRGLPSYRGEGTFFSWCDRVAARATFASLRRRRVELADGGRSAERVEDCRQVGGDDYVARREAVHALDGLPPEQRMVIVLHHVVGMSVPEIGGELRIPEETVRSRLRLGKARLRGLLEVSESGRRER